MRHGVILLCVLLAAALGTYAAGSSAVAGDYIEVRSNHVYTCGCLYSGEQVTGGREAILVWLVRDGEYRGTALGGAKAVAVLKGPENLGLTGAPRRSVMFVDGVSTEGRQALVEMLKEYYGAVLGELLSVQPAPISLQRDGERLTVNVAGLSKVVVRPARLPEDAHQGSSLWYAPFIPTDGSTLSTIEFASFRGDHLGHRWWEYDAGINGYIASFRLPR